MKSQKKKKIIEIQNFKVDAFSKSLLKNLVKSKDNKFCFLASEPLFSLNKEEDNEIK